MGNASEEYVKGRIRHVHAILSRLLDLDEARLDKTTRVFIRRARFELSVILDIDNDEPTPAPQSPMARPSEGSAELGEPYLKKVGVYDKASKPGPAE